MRFKLATRKIQLIHGTAFVSLPKAWVRNYRVQKGDSVTLNLREDGTLEISPAIVSNMGVSTLE